MPRWLTLPLAALTVAPKQPGSKTEGLFDFTRCEEHHSPDTEHTANAAPRRKTTGATECLGTLLRVGLLGLLHDLNNDWRYHPCMRYLAEKRGKRVQSISENDKVQALWCKPLT